MFLDKMQFFFAFIIRKKKIGANLCLTQLNQCIILKRELSLFKRE